MEKLGVQKEILYSDLRDEEGRLMQEMQAAMFDGEKTADDRSAIETRLQAVRGRISELDLKNG